MINGISRSWSYEGSSLNIFEKREKHRLLRGRSERRLEGREFILFNSHLIKTEDSRDAKELVRDSEEFEGEWEALISEILRLSR